ncbi:asparagine synthase (glutamine-hydrolyzing) [Microbacterium sp. 18062]|uniref:asparagine synthase (glutamine-hydrolyzing) n=1 Tax=Microbacterium sp. 18062 TaxID=2681410 RepID=UPI0013572B79|nr:asparagine synthase (glutamine-hydrolyzing) [Microbacterium sp. 18062]
MCGVCGVYSRGAPPRVEHGVAMLSRLGHRGPDGAGYYRDETVLLGHTRLAIVDLVGGVQPMANEDETVWVTFNGEIYNHPELRAELAARGHVFRTRSDTEVIVHAWEEWGVHCFERFNGQWALAIWDRRTRRLVLSRDRVGVHPLFYARADGDLVFASEVKALFADPRVRREWDAAGVRDALVLWSAVAPRTVFAGVSQVPPGCCLIVSEGREELHPYWAPTFPERGQEPLQDLEENARMLREAVLRATRLRFERADVPVGAYLSGGLDSAVTAGAIARFTDAELHTFSVRFSDADYDEGRHQAQVAASLGTVHHELRVTEQDIAEVFPEAVWHAETVLPRTAPAPMLLLSRLARERGFPVVVTGEGADEVLAGYDVFRELRVRELMARDPASPVRAEALALLYPWLRRAPQQAPAFARAFFARGADPGDPGLSHRPRWDAGRALTSMLVPGLEASVETGEERLLGELGRIGAGWDSLSRAQWLELTTLLPGYILSSQGDRMLMAGSVEGRFPFLDPEVVELASRFPARQKLLGLDEKHLLKRAFADLVPETIRRRPKQPYRAPEASRFFAGRTPDWLDDVTSAAAVADAGVFRPDAVAALVRKARAAGGRGMGNTDDMRLATVLSTQLLAHRLLGARETVPPLVPVAVRDLVRTEEERAA